MKRIIALAIFLIFNIPALGQDLIIENATVITSTGEVIEQGNVVVSDGQIVSVSAEAVSAEGTRIDATGLTVMPGLIDTHRHDVVSNGFSGFTSYDDVWQALDNETPSQMNSLLNEGFTTIMVPGGFTPLLSRISSLQKTGKLRSPQILFAGQIFTAPGDHPAQGPVCQGNPFCAQLVTVQIDDPVLARSVVQEQSIAGVKAIKAILDDRNIPDATLDEAVLAAIIDEAHSLGMTVHVHAGTVDHMILAVSLGADRLVHHPNDALIQGTNGSDLLLDNSVSISTTISFATPEFSQASGGQRPFDSANLEMRLANIRYLWDEGVTVAFGTDSPQGLRPLVEIKYLSQVLSSEEIITSLTRNAAIYLGLENKIGTLEIGKQADILIVDGNPLDDVMNVANVKIVIQNGQIVVDNL